MRLDTAQLIEDQNSALVLPERTNCVDLLQIEAQDTLLEVFDVLRQQENPILLLLSAFGDAFSQSEHFMALRYLLAEKGYPLFLCLIIPSRRASVVSLAAQYGIQSASSMEEALQSLVLSHLPSKTEIGYVAPPPQRTKQPLVTERFWKVEVPTSAQGSLFIRGAKKHPYLLSAIIALLLVASAMALPLMLFTPTSSQPSATGLLGTLMFKSSWQFNPSSTEGYNDVITLSLRNIPPPSAGMGYYAWLMPDQSDDATVPLLLGSLHAGSIDLTY